MQRKVPLTIACLLTHIFWVSPTWAGFCHAIEGEIHTTVTPADFQGAGLVSVDGRSYRMEVSGINMGFTETEDDGTQHAVTSTDWHIRANGVKFTTFEDARLDPTDSPGVFLYVGRSRVTTGNSRYDCGEMVIQGEVDFNAGTGSFPAIRGKLCRCD